MINRTRFVVVVMVTLLHSMIVQADIYRWDTGEVISGTEGIELAPSINLSSWNSDQHNLRYGDLARQDLSHSNFKLSWLDDADLTESNLAGSELSYAWITHGNFTEANLAGAMFYDSFLNNANFSGANLEGANLSAASLTNANFSGAVVKRANLASVMSILDKFTLAQLKSTVSYQSKDLQGIGLGANNLTDWDFREQNLTGALLNYSTLNNVDFSEASLRGANLDFSSLARADLTGTDLTGARLFDASLDDANLTGANLRNADLQNTRDLTSAVVESSTIYNQWTVFPNDFDPVAAGLSFVLSPTGDWNGDDLVSNTDIDMLSLKIRGISIAYSRLGDAPFDLNGDGRASAIDYQYWVKDVKHTWLGDANLDGSFDTTDVVEALAAGQYEDRLLGNSGWATGDWDADGDFTTSDLVTALADGGYEQGPRAAVGSVPEPVSIVMLIVGWIVIAIGRRDIGLRSRAA